MKNRYIVKTIIAVAFVVAIVIVGCLLFFRRQEFTSERAMRVFKKYESELTTIAEYVSVETRWSRYYNKEDPWESYLNADFLPEQVVKSMTVYFEKIAKAVLPCIEKIDDESMNSFDVGQHTEEGTLFFIYSGYQGKDGEGVLVLVYQYLIYLVSDNPDLSLQEYGESRGRGWYAVSQIADNWYFMTILG